MHTPGNWDWFRGEVGGTTVDNLAWPLIALLPAVGTYLSHEKRRQPTAAKWLGISLLVGIVGTAAPIISVSMLFARMRTS